MDAMGTDCSLPILTGSLHHFSDGGWLQGIKNPSESWLPCHFAPPLHHQGSKVPVENMVNEIRSSNFWNKNQMFSKYPDPSTSIFCSLSIRFPPANWRHFEDQNTPASCPCIGFGSQLIVRVGGFLETVIWKVCFFVKHRYPPVN